MTGLIFEEFAQWIDAILRNMGGRLGKRLRRWWYRRRLGACGVGLDTGIGVVIQSPRQVFLGDHVCLDDNCQLLAGHPKANDRTQYTLNPAYQFQVGEIHIGNGAHIGISTIIQGLGGVQIGDYFTTSPGAKIYSLSNDFRRCLKGTIGGDCYYFSSPIVIGHNSWLGMQTIVTKGTIGSNCFAKPNSVITGDIPDNSLVEGFPAQAIGARLKTQV